MGIRFKGGKIQHTLCIAEKKRNPESRAPIRCAPGSALRASLFHLLHLSHGVNGASVGPGTESERAVGLMGCIESVVHLMPAPVIVTTAVEAVRINELGELHLSEEA